MKIHFSIKRLRLNAGFAVVLGLAPLSSWLWAQSPSPEFAGVDVTSTVTVGPVIDARSITSSPSTPAGDLKTEVGVHRFPELRPPMKRTGAPLEQIQTATPFAAVADTAAQPHVRGFTGLTHRDQRFANGGNQFSHEPPDQGLAVGNNFVMEAVNCAINIYDVNGVVQLPRPLALTEIFGLPEEFNRSTGVINKSVGDPSCLFDPETQRWFVMAWTQLNKPNGEPLRQSFLYLAVSKSADPTGQYRTYTFNTTGASDVDLAGPRVPDFPHFAVDRYGLYINWQEFKIDQNGNLDGYIGTAIIAISKNILINGGSGGRPHVQRFALPFETGFEFRIWPAYIPPGQTPVLANAGTEYFLSSNLGFDSFNQIAVWALTNTSSLNTANPNLRLKMTTVDTLAYHFPDFSVPQKDGFHPYGAAQGFPVADLDAGPDSISSCEYVNGHIWGTLSSAAKDGSGQTTEVVAYFAFTPQFKNGAFTASRFTQGIIASPGRFLMYPAIALNKDNVGTITFSLSSRNDYPSAAFVTVRGTSTSGVQIAREGNEPEDGFTCYPPFSDGVCRWGDYSAGAVNNVDQTAWGATEYVPDINRSFAANWATYVLRFEP